MKIFRTSGLFKRIDAFPQHDGKLYERIHYEDLHEVKYLSYSEIYRLIDNAKKALEAGIETRFINVSPEVTEQLRELDLEGIIKFE